MLSRYDARVMVEQSYEGEVLDDDLYRKLIKWKILLNTNDCTYWSIMKGIKMFWDKTPVYYRTDPKVPATIILSTQLPELEIDYNLKAAVPLVPVMWSAMQTKLPEIQIEEGGN